jgi:predicted amidohydrolase YtcJ
MLDAGAKVVLESDSNSYIWEDLEAAITRKDRNGKVWAPQERIDRPTTLRMMTSWAADYVLKGDKLGSIEPGKLADLLVLDKDYLTVPEDSIHTIQPQMTIFDGKIVYVHSQYAQENNLRPSGALISTYNDLVAQRKFRAGGTAFGGG